MPVTPRHKGRIFWPILGVLIVADYATKVAAVASLPPPGIPHRVLGNTVRLTLAFNHGAAMGLPLGPHARQILGVIGVLVAGVLFAWYLRTPREAILLPAALALLTGGALGNAWQRLFSTRGVVDFVDVGVGHARFWTFNLADAGLTVGVLLLLIHFWWEEARERAPSAGGLP